MVLLLAAAGCSEVSARRSGWGDCCERGRRCVVMGVISLREVVEVGRLAVVKRTAAAAARLLPLLAPLNGRHWVQRRDVAADAPRKTAVPEERMSKNTKQK